MKDKDLAKLTYLQTWEDIRFPDEHPNDQIRLVKRSTYGCFIDRVNYLQDISKISSAGRRYF